MPKIKNWSRVQDAPYPTWEHDVTGDSITVGPADQTEYDGHGTPKEYQVTLWGREGLNNRVVAATFSSVESAMEEAKRIARKNIDGKLVKSQREKYRNLEWGEGEPEVETE